MAVLPLLALPSSVSRNGLSATPLADGRLNPSSAGHHDRVDPRHVTGSAPDPHACPRCGRATTRFTPRSFGLGVLFCPDCEESWWVCGRASHRLASSRPTLLEEGSHHVDPLERYLQPCPECKREGAIITLRRHGTLILFCPECEHGWTATERRARERRQHKIAVAHDIRVAPRRSPVGYTH